jgi:hypothetical protein
MRIADLGAQRCLGRRRGGEDEVHALELGRATRVANREPN